ncbi:response regulator receiver domain-containing protein [Motilibacter rhizosphaerae]|uniref:Response regulator receiver domain-containing protein n=1 Tax=Motilibacter rhizosphaerae TaxID=598652 RepID=A0A4Q7NT40_9ACTN|nr:response regulator [Motilibacter rhizosphaerae]RZS90323.1 response regulator receiver domain-containing protein [Motilibacter rhizosphaerae]
MARVLVVEDDQDARLLISACLRRAGHTVLTAESGYQALSLVFEEGLPEAAVLDLHMPGMDGFDVLTALQATGLAGANTVVLTAVQGSSARAAVTARGAHYLAKPFYPSELTAAVEECTSAA